MQLTLYDFDLAQIYASGQCFRWESIGGGTYRIPAFGRVLTVHQSGHLFDFACDPEEFRSVWHSYFDLDTDYAFIKAQIDSGDHYLQAAAGYGWGIRILRQDLWEMIVSFIVSQNNNIPRIRKNLNALCSLQNGEFPSPAVLAATPPEVFRSMGLGYRADYLCDAGRFFQNRKNLDLLRTMDYSSACEMLRRVKGIGPKVADCICLFGLHHVDAFPIDTHIRQILKAHYSEGFPLEHYRGFAGILQQYLFYYDLAGNI